MENNNVNKWIDKPDKAGYWWVADAIDDKTLSLNTRIHEIIDYETEDKGLEVYTLSDTIPVDEFIRLYHPKSKWLFIPEPNIPKEKD